MSFTGLVFLLTAHYLCGRGILRLFKLQLPAVTSSCLSFIIGVPLVSVAPCILQLFHIPLTTWPLLLSVALVTCACSAPLFINYKVPSFKLPALPVYYEWPFMVAFAFFMAFSAWHAFYYPPYARDMLSGPELVSKYAIKEHSLINSVFTIDLKSTNNYLKSPFITCLQLLYKTIVCPFGQVWLSVIALPFYTWLYAILRQRLHGITAGFLLLCFIVIPELYSYSYVMLYDFSNMVFFFAGFYFLCGYLANDRLPALWCSAFLFGLATYIRVETLLLVCMTALLLAYCFYKKRLGMYQSVRRLSIFLMVPAAFYFICMRVFVYSFVPAAYRQPGQQAIHLQPIMVLLHRFLDMNKELIFSSFGIALFGYFIFFFCAVLVVDIVWPRRFNRQSRVALYGIAVVYIGLPILGYLLPVADLMNTTKRGLFKMLPLMLLYLGNSGVMHYISIRISIWQHTEVTEKKETDSAPAIGQMNNEP